MMSPAGPLKSGFVAIAGRPNVGKSTLVNALAGGKVAIVSDKPQTTRRRISAVVNGDLDSRPYQLVLVDLPGFQRPRDPLTEHMQRTVDQALEDVDGFVLVLAADEPSRGGDRFVAERVFSAGPPVVVALNKVDRLRPAAIAERIAQAAELGDFHALHPVSARTGDGVDALRGDLVELLPDGPQFFDRDERTDLPLDVQVAELVREQALALTREEVPHAVSVEVDELDLDGGRVRAFVNVETQSQKAIVVGKGGSMIREIGTRARPEVERLLGRRVFLELQVKVRPRWRRDERVLEQLGI
jgi:GTPase